jgi:hypothetical protein
MMIRIKRRIIWIASVALGLVLLVGLVGPLIPYKRVANSVCPVSGSTRQEITWFGRFSHEERTVSALEQWLKHREPTFQPQWRHTSTQTYYVLGRACGTAGAPEICQLRPILGDVVEEFSDERIAALVAVLRQGSRDEQREVIQRISDDYFSSFSSK